MLKKNSVRKFALAVAFVVFLGAGYLAMSVATSCPAKATALCCNCLCDLNLGPAITLVGSAINIPLIQLQEVLQSAFFEIANIGFYESVVSTTWGVTDDVVSVTDTMFDYNIYPAMRAMTRQLNTAKSSQARQRGAFMDAANVNRANTAFEKAEFTDYRELRPGENTCVAGTVTGGMARSNNFRRAYSASAPAEKAGRSGNAAGTPGASGPAADMSERWQTYTTRYCKRNDNNGFSGCTADQAFAGADLDVAGTIFLKDTIDLRDRDTEQTVNDLLENIVEPFVKDVVPATAVDSASGSAAILAGESYKTRRQTIYDSLYQVVARRVPGSGMGSFIEPLRTAAGISPGMISDNPSYNEIMQAMMSERFRSGKYALSQIDDPENNQREMVIQHAFQLMQMSDQLDLMDRYALMLAAHAGAQIKEATPAGTAVEGAPL